MLKTGIIFGGIVVAFFLLGILFRFGKGAWRIAGYNTASAAEKSRYDEKALCRFMGKMMFAMSGTWCVVTVGLLLDIMAVFWVGFVLFLAVIFGGVVYANTGNRFIKN